MTPASPIVPGAQLEEIVLAKNQPEYIPLPVHRMPDGTMLCRWHCSFWERLRILWTGDVYLWQLTFNRPLQPISLQAEPPEVK